MQAAGQGLYRMRGEGGMSHTPVSLLGVDRRLFQLPVSAPSSGSSPMMVFSWCTEQNSLEKGLGPPSPEMLGSNVEFN